MRKVLALLVVLGAVCAVGAAAAKTTAVSITKNGYVPNATSITQGDSVAFTNADTVAHQVTFKQTTGVTCTPNPLVLQPGQSGTCTFATAGKYDYSDPNVKGRTFTGTVTVAAVPESLSLSASPLVVTFGGSTTLSGTLSTQKVGENVDVYAQPCGAAAATKATTVATTTGGAFSVAIQPQKNTVYTVKVRNTSSGAVTVKVRPRLRLSRLAPHRFTLRATAADSFAGKYASFQRYNSTLGRWVAVKVVRLVGTSTTFRSSVKVGLRVRAVLGQAQVGACYLAGTSNAIRS